MKDKPQKQISIDAELHKNFKGYCANKKVFMSEMINQIIEKELIDNGYKLTTSSSSGSFFKKARS